MTLARRPRQRPRYMSFEGGPIDGEVLPLGYSGQEAPPYYVHRMTKGVMHRYKRDGVTMVIEVDGKDLLRYVHEGSVNLGPDE